MHRHAIRRRLSAYRQQPGNWRLKGLFLALEANAQTVGQAWPQTKPQTPREFVHLGDRPAETSEAAVVRDLYADHDSAVVARDEYIRRALVNETETELDVLWREELTATVVAGAAPRKVARRAGTEQPVDAKKGDLPTRGTEPYASTGAETAGASFDEQDYHQTAYDCELHEEGFALTEALIDEAEPAALEEQVRQAGAAVENAINRQFINELLDNGTTYDADISGGGNTDTRDLLLKASETLADNDFDPTDTLVMHPEYASELFGNNQLAGLNGIDSDTGGDDAVVGHDPFIMSGSAYDSGSNTYGFEADGELGALVFGQRFVQVPVYREIEVSDLQPPFTAIHDLQGGVARAWTDSVAVDEDGNGTYESVAVVQR